MNEPRLIDANALLEYLVDLEPQGGHLLYQRGMRDALQKLFPQIIDDQSTIDPETLPIVRELRAELFRYEQAEKEGRLVVLPCKVGDTVLPTSEGTRNTSPKLRI